jgi:hypothetical protein
MITEQYLYILSLAFRLDLLEPFGMDPSVPNDDILVQAYGDLFFLLYAECHYFEEQYAFAPLFPYYTHRTTPQ